MIGRTAAPRERRRLWRWASTGCAVLFSAAAVCAPEGAAGVSAAPVVSGRSTITTIAIAPHLAGNALAVGSDGAVYTSSAPPYEALYKVTQSKRVSLVAAAKGLSVEGIAVARDGNVYISVVDPAEDVRKIALDGKVTVVARRPGWSPGGLVLDGNQNLYVADFNGRIWRITRNGQATVFATVGANVHPVALALGADGTMYAACVFEPSFTSGVLRIDRSGRATRLTGPKGGVRALAVDAAGTLFVSTTDYRVLELDRSGKWLPVAGSGVNAFSGDSGPAVGADLGLVGALAFGPDGSLYASDIDNNAIRRITPGVSSVALPPATLPRSSATTFDVPLPIQALAADGAWVAADERLAKGGGNGTTCDSIVFWKATTGAHASSRDRCGDTRNTSSLARLALAGTRAVWVDYDYSNHAYCTLVTASAERPTPVALRPKPVALDVGCTGEQDDLVGAVAGQGSLLVLNRWTLCGGGVDCKNPVTVDGDKVIDPSLVRLDGTTATRIASGAGSLLVAGVSAARIVLVRPDGSIAVLTAGGSLIRVVNPHATVRGATLDDRHLVVLTTRSLLDYDLDSGTLRARRSLLPTAVGSPLLRGVNAGIAAYTAGGTIALLDLANGRTTAFRPSSTTLVTAFLTPAGLFYGYSTPAGGHLAYIKASDVVRSVR